jgi:hypothetical protein
MEDLTVTAKGYDFGEAHAAMQRYVDGNLLSGISSAVLVGREASPAPNGGFRRSRTWPV